MKTISTLLLAGALALGFGTATGFAGDSALQTNGRSGYRSVPVKQDRETTVAIYTGRNSEAATTAQTEPKPGHIMLSQGRAGYLHVTEN